LKYSFTSFLFLFILTGIIKSQSPGGIAASNTLWLRSDNGVTTTGTTVIQWEEFSGAGVTDNFTVQSLTGTTNTQTGPLLVNAGINFNPYLSFDGITSSLSSINSFFGTSLVGNSNVTVFQVLNLKSGIVWLKWETDQQGTTARFGFENAAGRIRFDFPRAVPATAGQNVGVTNVLNKHSLSTTYADATASVNRLNGADDNTIPIPAPGNFGGLSTKLVIGNEDLINLPCQVDIAEIIVYANTLSAADRNKIESYLAVKYGFTLNQAAVNNNNYTTSGAFITWNRAANSVYANDITGIGRDDATALLQKQSKSINTSSLITLYNGTYPAGIFPSVNAANTSAFSVDQVFLLVGDNAGTTTLNQCAFNGKAKRMQRVWKASSTGSVIPVTIAVDQGSVPAAVTHMMVSGDPLFPAGSTTLYPLATAGGKLYTTVTLNHNEYFTFGTDTVTVNLAVTQPSCINPTGGNVTTTVTGGNPPFTYLWTPSGQVTANLVNVAAGTYTLTISQGSCQSTQAVNFTAPVIPASPTINNVPVCSGNTATLTVQNPVAGYIYNWYDVATGGTVLGSGISFITTAISANTTYYAEAVSGSCSSVRTSVIVNVNNVGAPVVAGVSVCSGTTATLTVQAPAPANTYNWYPVAAGGTSIGTGVSFTTAALTNNTTYYVDALNAGCTGPRTSVTATVVNPLLPVVNSVTACEGSLDTLTVQNPDAAYTYNWYATATGGTVLGTGNAFITAAITGTTIYYTESVISGCSSVRVPVTVNSYAPLQAPLVTAGNITASTVTFSWLPVAGSAGYEVSVNGGPYGTPSSGSNGISHLVTGLQPAETVIIDVIALAAVAGCPNSPAGSATAKTELGGFYVPTAFTPNGDTRNDILRPVLPGSASLEFFQVYNRWGEKVFFTRTIGEGWDGKWKGKNQPASMYVWICRYIYNGTVFNEKGSFMLLH